MSSSFFNHTFASDVTFSQLLSSEILKTNSQGKLSGLSQSEAFGFVNAKSYGAIADLVYTVNSDLKTVTYVSGSDATTPIQNALNAASTLAGSASTNYKGKITCYIPGGNYRITSLLTIPSNVILRCDGTLFNFITNSYTPIVLGSKYSECDRLTVFANDKNGVQWCTSSDIGSDVSSAIAQISVYSVGNTYSAGQTYQQAGLRLFGSNINLGNIYLEGGYIGLDIWGRQMSASNIVLLKSKTGLILNSSEHIIFKTILWDTITDVACKIDGSSDCFIYGTAYVNSTLGGTPMSKGIVVGANTLLFNSNLDIKYTAQSTGGLLLDIANIEDSKVELSGTNSRNSNQVETGNSSHWIGFNGISVAPHNVGTQYIYNNGTETETALALINYGSNVLGFLDIELSLDENIAFLFSGTQVGYLNIVSNNYVLTYLNNVNKTTTRSLTIEYVTAGSYSFTLTNDYLTYEIESGSPGGGAGSGRLGAAGTIAYGGGGGSGGVISKISGLVSAILISNSPTIFDFIIGATGKGGAAISTSSTDGIDGTSGGTNFITRRSDSFNLLTVPGGNVGRGGTTGLGTGGTALITGISNGAAGTASSPSATPNTPTAAVVAPGGGAGGGGISAANVPFNGGNRGVGGSMVGTNTFNNTGGTASTTAAGGNGSDGQTKAIYGNSGGHGGAGGGASTFGNGGKGGKGLRGGGGAGGGAARNGTGVSSGAGNDGGAGWTTAVFRA